VDRTSDGNSARRRYALAMLVSTVVFGASALPSAADSGTDYGGGVQGPTADRPDPVVWAGAVEGVPVRRGAAGPQVVCTINAPVAAVEAVGPGDVVADPEEGQTYFLVCRDGGTYLTVREFVYTPRPPVDAATLGRYAARDLPLSYPAPSTAPPRVGLQLVGVRTWLWVDPADLTEVVGTASVPGMAVTARARPESVSWDMGDGTPEVTCAGAGTPYDPTVADEDQSTDCSHGFNTAGTYDVTVSIRWHVTWTSTTGETGDLGVVPRGVTFPVTVQSRQAVITG